jgi:hypothetical protein
VPVRGVGEGRGVCAVATVYMPQTSSKASMSPETSVDLQWGRGVSTPLFASCPLSCLLLPHALL